MTSRHVFEGTQFNDYTLNYDAENRLVSVTGAATASFVYDGDGKQIKATVNGITAVYVGNHYEVKNSIVTKYYFAGSTRIAVRKDGTLNFLLADHIGSSSVTTNANGAKTASALYKAFGETRYALGSLNTDYKFTGQREEASLGIYFFVARWFDPSLGRFLSPDTIVPTSTQGTQAWDRYAFVNNNPVRYNDPTGHMGCDPEAEGHNCQDDKASSTICTDTNAQNYGDESGCTYSEPAEAVVLPFVIYAAGRLYKGITYPVLRIYGFSEGFTNYDVYSSSNGLVFPNVYDRKSGLLMGGSVNTNLNEIYIKTKYVYTLPKGTDLGNNYDFVPYPSVTPGYGRIVATNPIEARALEQEYRNFGWQQTNYYLDGQGGVGIYGGPSNINSGSGRYNGVNK